MPPSSAISHRRLLWPTLLTLAGMAVLLGLGSWQMQRLQWKQGLIARIAQRVHGVPVPLVTVLANPGGYADIEYLHVSATGRFHHDRETYLYASGKGDWGYDVFTPLELPDGRSILINRGYIGRQQLDRASRSAGLTPGAVTLNGLIRLGPGARPWYIPAGDSAHRTWSWPEIESMAKANAATANNTITQFYIDADATHVPVAPSGGTTNLELPNRHLEYAITWFALACTLAVIYAVFAFRRLSPRRG